MSKFNWKTTTTQPVLPHTEPCYSAYLDEVQTLIPKMVEDGKTDGWIDVNVDHENQCTIIYRFWATKEDASTWKDWIESKNLNGKYSTVTISYIG